MHGAGIEARSEPSRRLELLTPGLRWLGERGMGWARLRPSLRPLSGRKVTPAAIIVHLGSNDLGSMSLKALIGWAKTEIDWLEATFPAAEIIWSDILARQFYRGASSQKNDIWIYGGSWGLKRNPSTKVGVKNKNKSLHESGG